MTEAPRADLTKVPEEIATMFDSVATRYDMMDTLMTGGLNHVWMTALRKAVAPHPGERILDLAAGTGRLPGQGWRRSRRLRPVGGHDRGRTRTPPRARIRPR